MAIFVSIFGHFNLFFSYFSLFLIVFLLFSMLYYIIQIMYVYIYIYIYTHTKVLLCVYTHSECGSICQVDAIVMLIWSKVCITKAITISITISIQKLSSTFNHTIQKLSFVENCSDSRKTGRIPGKLVRFLEN